MKVLVFDIASDYAHFRKPYTTTSALTYSVPPRTAIVGLLGNIIGVQSGGFGRSEQSSYFEARGLKTGVRVLRSVRKTTFNLKYLHTKSGGSILVPVECVVSPNYRIYVTGNTQLLSVLKGKLENCETHFTPCLGISEFIASIDYIGEYEANDVNGEVLVDSIVYLFDEGEIRFESGLNLFRETHAIYMDNDRRVQSYSEIAYEEDGKRILLLKNPSQSEIVKLNGAEEEVVMLV
ncbi:MAG TPA: type I-B CRISPR-associated protein Cas5 [Mesotoga infera]|uniref:Type I-B CRISPR-associated protein Cas5 n=1 Tax=Mesotoga infera TaxID=1236046 RepID=A0A7C1CY28_9BACT|nr:type I-B CRISPR-associated protein Cas5 [Mesotoga infera]